MPLCRRALHPLHILLYPTCLHYSTLPTLTYPKYPALRRALKTEQDVLLSLQTALDAASDYRKQVEENQGEKQQLVLTMQHELNQVGSCLNLRASFT